MDRASNGCSPGASGASSNPHTQRSSISSPRPTRKPWTSGAAEGAGQAGHIPGSIHLPIEALRDAQGRFVAPEEMRRLLREHGVTAEHRVVTYCTIGNRASQAWYALSRLLDYPDTGVYHGSWAEWGTHPNAPIER